MTVCLFDGEYREANFDGLINMEKTVNHLKNAEKLIDSVHESR